MENDWYLRLERMTSKLSYLNSNTKTMYHRRLGEKHNFSADVETYYPFLKTLVDGKKVPKICLLLIYVEFVSNFQDKAYHFNAFFGKQILLDLQIALYLKLFILPQTNL